MSGRALRRLPVLALARYIGVGYAGSESGSTKRRGAAVELWLDGMEKAVHEQGTEREKLL